MPHQNCPAWTWPLLYIFIIANLLIAGSYFAIPILLLRTRIRVLNATLILFFALFIFSCGITHVFKIVLVYKPWFWLAALLDSATGIISFVTVILLRKNAMRLVEIPQSVTYEEVIAVRERIAALSEHMRHA